MNRNFTELDCHIHIEHNQYNFNSLYCPDNLLPTNVHFRNAEIPRKYTLQEIQPSQQLPSVIDKFLHIRINPKLRAVHADHMQFTFHEDVSFPTELLYYPLCQLNLPKNDVRSINVSYNQLGR